MRVVAKQARTCSFCRSCIETHDHMFFQCSFSKRIWQEVVRRYMVDNSYVKWEEVLEWGVNALKWKSLTYVN
jgi:hypothetical protein